MFENFVKHIDEKLPFLSKQPVIVACSGGIDSVVLAFLLKKIGQPIALAHYNFSLRGAESNEDSNFVMRLADKLSVPFFVCKNPDTRGFAEDRKLSVQMAARELRYAWFDKLLSETEYQYVLTAHHADDSLETHLINLSRGSGIQGLTGIPEINNRIVRPLLPFTREEIAQYARDNDIEWREDSSNSSPDYLRNTLRHDVIPILKKVAPNVVQGTIKSHEYLGQSSNLVDDYLVLIKNLVVTESKDGWEIDIEKLKDLPNTKALIYELFSPFGFTAWSDIHELINADSGKQVYSSTHRLLKDREKLILTTINDRDEIMIAIGRNENRISSPIKLQFSKVDEIKQTDANTIFVDSRLLKFPLQLRRWRSGDYFFPFGMKGKKKLSKFFKDEKLSLVAKENCWVLTSTDKVVWIVGLRPDDRFKVTGNTKEIVKIEYSPE